MANAAILFPKSLPRKVRIVLVGCGRHATVILHTALRFMEEFEVVGCCDLNEERAKFTARSFGLNTYYTDLDKMLDAVEAEAALVVSFPKVQPELVVKCLDRGLHVYCEKPLATSMDQAKAIADASRRAGKHVMVGFMKRFNPAYARLKNAICSEEFGRPSLIEANFAGGYRPATFDLLAVGSCHLFDLGRFLIGDVESVYANLHKREEGHVAFAVSLRFTNGAVGLYNLNSLSQWCVDGERVEVTGDRNVASVDNCRKFLWIKPPEKAAKIGQTQDMYEEPSPAEFIEPTYTHCSYLERQTYYMNGFYQALQHFGQCLIYGKTPSVTFEDGIKALEIALAINESAITGRPVVL